MSDDPLNPRNITQPEKVLSVSPVNYRAWRDGYLPPTEHILIHNLIYEDARVLMSTGADAFSFWVVARGKLPTGASAKIFVKMIESQLEDIASDLAMQAEENDATEFSGPEQRRGAPVSTGSPERTATPETAPDVKPATADVSSQASTDETQTGDANG